MLTTAWSRRRVDRSFTYRPCRFDSLKGRCSRSTLGRIEISLMRKNLYEYISPLILGVASCHLYFWLSNYLAAYSYNLFKLISEIPQPFRLQVYWLVILIRDSLFALPVIALACIAGSYFIKHSPYLYGVLFLVSYLSAYVHYHIFLIPDFGFVGPLWLEASKVLIIAALFMCTLYFIVSFKEQRTYRIAKN